MGVWPAITRLLNGTGESAIVVLGGDNGTSSTIISPSKAAELPLCDLRTVSTGTGGLPGKSIYFGAELLLVDNGDAFSSSVMIGSLRVLLLAFDGGEVMLEIRPFAGDSMVAGEMTGDFAGLKYG